MDSKEKRYEKIITALLMYVDRDNPLMQVFVDLIDLEGTCEHMATTMLRLSDEDLKALSKGDRARMDEAMRESALEQFQYLMESFK